MKKQGADSNGNCPNRSRKRGKWNDRAEEDRISALPCEILALILSCLTLKEAANTSIVSRRWKDLWKYFMGVLDFDGGDALAMLYMSSQTERFARTKYVNWVYQVLDSLRCSTVEGFRICFPVDRVQTLEEWIRFAIQKKVKIFELNLTSGGRHPRPKDITNFMLPPCLVNSFDSFDSLRTLRLKWVDVTTESMDSLLSSCVHLEELSLERSARIEALKLSSPSLKLKCLKIWHCISLRVVEISAMYLLSFVHFACHGQKTRISFIHVPSLKEVSLGFDFQIEDLPSHRLVLSQLQTLKMDLLCCFSLDGIFRDIPELGNVIHLELYASFQVAAVACETFFKACTGLQRFTFKTLFDQSAHCWKFDNFHPLRSLQVVEVVGFYGLPAEVELLKYFLQSSEQLEKIIIDTYCLGLTGSLKKWGMGIPRCRIARDRALELKAAFPLWEFVIL